MERLHEMRREWQRQGRLGDEYRRATLKALQARHPRESPLSPKHAQHPAIARLRALTHGVREEDMGAEFMDLAEWFAVATGCRFEFVLSVRFQLSEGRELSVKQAHGLLKVLQPRLYSGRWATVAEETGPIAGWASCGVDTADELPSYWDLLAEDAVDEPICQDDF